MSGNNMRKHKNNLPLGRVWNFPLGVVCGMIAVFIFLSMNTNAFNLTQYITNSMRSSELTAFTVSNLNDNVTTQIINFCKPFTQDDQVNCVVSQVSGFYNYTPHNDTIRTPTELKNEGGVCRDASVVYATIFQRLGWQTRFNFPKATHVNIIITKQYNETTYQCTVDQTIYTCAKY